MFKHFSWHLDSEHITFITDPNTLIAWRPYSLRARTRLFHRQFPDKFISARRLRSIYRDHGIKKRRIQPYVSLNPSQLTRQKQGRLEAFPVILEEIQCGRPIYFADESCFTSAQSESNMWMLPGVQPTLAKRNKLSFASVAACAAIDAQGSLLLYHTVPKSYDSDRFYAFMELFISKASLPCTLVLDNLNIHRTNKVKTLCQEKGVRLIFNGTYSSQYMPVERLWLFAKLYWRKEVASISNFKDQAMIRSRIEKCISQAPQRYLANYV